MESIVNNDGNLVARTALSAYNVFIHALMGIVVGIPLLFAVVKRYNEPSVSDDNMIMLHIIICVIGYQLLMPQAILSLCPYNSWTASLSDSVKRHVHWILQLVGSGLAIAGSIVIMVYKDDNFNTTHGKLGLTALIFTALNLMTGIFAILSQRLSSIISSYVPKLIHIVLGIVAFTCASSCLCYGFDKDAFRTWTNDMVTTGVIAIAGIFCLIIIINPLVTLVKTIIHIIKDARN